MKSFNLDEICEFLAEIRDAQELIECHEADCRCICTWFDWARDNITTDPYISRDDPQKAIEIITEIKEIFDRRIG